MTDIISKFKILLNKAQKKKLIILINVSTIAAFFEMLGVSMIVPIVSVIMNPDILQTNKYIILICSIFDITDHTQFLIFAMLGMILLFIVKALFLVYSNYYQISFVNGCRTEMQKKVFDSIIHRPYEYFLYAESGDIMNILHDDIIHTFDMLMTLVSLLSESIISIAVVAVIFIINPLLTIVIAVLISILVFVILKVIKPIVGKKGIEYSRFRSVSNKWELQTINGIKDIKVAQKEDFFKDKYYTALGKMLSAFTVYKLSEGIPRTLIELGCITATLISMIILVLSGRNLATLISGFAALALAAVKLMPSANRVVNAVSSIAYNRNKIDRLIDTLSNMEDKTYNESSGTSITLRKELKMENVSFKYEKSNVYIFKDASVTISAGKCVGIVGPSGIGKTTAVDIILGLLRPERGQVFSDGVDITTNYQSWLSLVGYIPQSIFMLNGTIRENVVFGEDDISDEKVWEALREAQLEDFVKTLPDGLDSQIGERGIRLSGGQRQRIGIARALYSNPELLIFDEATSSLDNETESAIMESINSLHGKKTMIIIAHRLQTIENCDEVYRVVGKRIGTNE